MDELERIERVRRYNSRMISLVYSESVCRRIAALLEEVPCFCDIDDGYGKWKCCARCECVKLSESMKDKSP